MCLLVEIRSGGLAEDSEVDDMSGCALWAWGGLVLAPTWPPPHRVSQEVSPLPVSLSSPVMKLGWRWSDLLQVPLWLC